MTIARMAPLALPLLCVVLATSGCGSPPAKAPQATTKPSGSEADSADKATPGTQAENAAAKSETKPRDSNASLTPETPDSNPKASRTRLKPLKVELKEIAAITMVDPAARQLVFSPDGSRLALASLSPTKLWNVPALNGETKFNDSSESVAFMPGGDALLTSGKQLTNRSQLLDLKTGKARKEFEHGIEFPRTTIVTPDGKTALYSEGNSGTDIRIWDLESGKQKRVLKTKPQFWVSVMAVSPDSRWLAYPDNEDAAIAIYDLTTGEEHWRYEAPPGIGGHFQIVAIQWFGDKGQIALLAGDGTYHQADVVNKTVDTQFLGLSDDEPWCFALSNDGRLAAYGVNGKIQLLDAWTGKKIQEVTAHPRQTERLAFSPDNTLLASINADDEVQLKLWKIEPINEER